MDDDQPMIQDQLDVAAATLRSEIDRHGPASANKLLAFAQTYATSTRLMDDAVVLQLECRSQPDVVDDDLVDRMLALISQIIDEQTAGSPNARMERIRMMMRMRERLQQLAPAHEEVFRGTGLVKHYARSGFKLGKLDLSLRLGEITGVVGQNAHGKTTLLRIVAGELQSDEGSLSYPLLMQDSTNMDWAAVKQHVAFVPQELPRWGGSLRDTLHYETSLHGIYGAHNKLAVDFIVERLGLGDHLDKSWTELSGGYKVRFALARALVWKPRLLVMDEPLANLDIKAKGVLLQDVRDLARSYSSPIAVIMSSHDLHNLESVCNQMVFLTGGQVRFAGEMALLGKGRTRNQYEIGTSLRSTDVQARLQDTVVEDVREEGLNLLLITGPDCSPSTLLKLLLEREIDIRYFRDHSQSIRQLFE